MGDIFDALSAMGAGFQGKGMEYQQQMALKDLGEKLASGQITQQQYLQQLALTDLMAARQVAGVNGPSALQELDAYQKMTPEQQKTYWNIKRAAPVVNLGGSQAVLSPSGSGQPVANLPVTLKPEDQPTNISEATTAKKGAELDASRRENLAKAQSALAGFEQQNKIVTDTLDKAIKLIDKPFSAATGTARIAGGFGLAPNSDSRALDNLLTTVKANIGFDTLQQMRENSPTGGALGNVSDNENKLTQAVKGALDPLQTDQLKENLKTIRETYPLVLEEKKKAFNSDYGKYLPEKEDGKTPVNSIAPAGKKVRVQNPQGQVGTIDASELDQAIQNGWKKL